MSRNKVWELGATEQSTQVDSMGHQTGQQGRGKSKVTRHSVRGGGQENTEGGDLESSRAKDGLQKATTDNSGVREEGP